MYKKLFHFYPTVIAFIGLISILFFSCDSSEKIKSVIIGDQEWMVNNLDVGHFRNGDNIPEAKTKEDWKKFANEKKPCWGYLNGDPINGKKYGKLYNWFVISDPRGIAPEGWHVPNDEEWEKLIKQVDRKPKKLMASKGWHYKKTTWLYTMLINGSGDTSYYNQNGDTVSYVPADKLKKEEMIDGSGSNETGFSAMPGGSSFADEDDLNRMGYWWSSSVETRSDGTLGPKNKLYMGCGEEGVFASLGHDTPLYEGYSVRCIKNITSSDKKSDKSGSSKSNDNYKDDLVGNFAYEQGGREVIRISNQMGNYFVSILQDNKWTELKPLVDASEENCKKVFGDNWKSYVKGGFIYGDSFGIFKVEKGYEYKPGIVYKTGYVFILGFAGGDAFKL